MGHIFFVDREAPPGRWGGLYTRSPLDERSLVEATQRALSRGREWWGRSTDLATVVFDEVECSGLSSYIVGSGALVIRVNDVDRTVALCEPGREADRSTHPVALWSYADFLGEPDPWRTALYGDLPDEDRVLAAAREVLGGRTLELITNPDTGVIELYIVVVAAERPTPPDEVDVARLAASGIEADVGDELLFPIYYMPADEDLAHSQDASMARLLHYPINAWASMRRALDRSARRR